MDAVQQRGVWRRLLLTTPWIFKKIPMLFVYFIINIFVYFLVGLSYIGRLLSGRKD